MPPSCLLSCRSASAMNQVRRALSLPEKMRLIDAYDQGSSVKQLQDQFKCGKTQIYETLKRRHEYRKEYHQSEGKQWRGRTCNKAGSDVVNGVVWDWFLDAKSKNLPVNRAVLKAKANSVAAKLGITDFKAGADWFLAFRNKHNVPWTLLGELPGDEVMGTSDLQILPTRPASVEAIDDTMVSSIEGGPAPSEEGHSDETHSEHYLESTFTEQYPPPEVSMSLSQFSPSSFKRSLEDDAHEHFIRYVNSTLRSISPSYRKDMAKLEIQQVLIKYKHSVEVPLGQPSFTPVPSSTTETSNT